MSNNNIDAAFFDTYKKVNKDPAEKGVPHLEMNAQVFERRHKGSIGLELELEAITPLPADGDLQKVVGATTKARWSSIRDGSLRGDYAREFIVNRPITREEVDPMLRGLFDTMQLMGSQLNNSNRCSTHVHLNIGGKKINEITAMICLWTMFEEALIQYNGEERVSNHFALSVKDSRATIEAWLLFLRTGRPAVEARGLKYQAMNILPMWHLGSLEIRCGAAANDVESPIEWAIFLDTLATYATDQYKDLQRLGHDVSERGGGNIFEELCASEPALAGFAQKVYDKIGGREVFEDKALQGFRECQEIVYGFPWGQWKDLIDREYVPNPFLGSARRGGSVGRFVVPDIDFINQINQVEEELDDEEEDRGVGRVVNGAFVNPIGPMTMGDLDRLREEQAQVRAQKIFDVRTKVLEEYRRGTLPANQMASHLSFLRREIHKLGQRFPNNNTIRRLVF